MKRPENIEALLLDYAEGTLDPKYLLFVEAWLRDHPEDAELIEEFPILLEGSEQGLDLEFKSGLKAPEHPIDALFIGEIEKQLSANEQLLLDQLCSESHLLQKERKLYGLTKLSYPEKALPFPDKASLRKSKIIAINRKQIFRYAMIASMIALFFFLLPEHHEALYEARPSAFQMHVITFKESPLPELKSELIALSDLAATSSSVQEMPKRVQEEALIPMQTKKVAFNFGSKQNFLQKEAISSSAFLSENTDLMAIDNIPKTEEYPSFGTFLRDKILAKLNIEAKDKKTEEVLAQELSKLSGGKIRIDIEDGKLMAVQSPLLEWKKHKL